MQLIFIYSCLLTNAYAASQFNKIDPLSYALTLEPLHALGWKHYMLPTFYNYNAAEYKQTIVMRNGQEEGSPISPW